MTTENIEKFIQKSEKLTAIFSYWPDFHDAEVLEMHFWRGGIDPKQGIYDLPVLTIRMDLKEWADPGQPDANLVLKRRVFATLRFGDVDNFRMEGFNYQNAILGLWIDRSERTEGSTPYFRIHIEPAFGVGAEFECARIEVTDVVTSNAEGKPIA